jgi:hypothetical protein
VGQEEFRHCRLTLDHPGDILHLCLWYSSSDINFTGIVCCSVSLSISGPVLLVIVGLDSHRVTELILAIIHHRKYNNGLFLCKLIRLNGIFFVETTVSVLILLNKNLKGKRSIDFWVPEINPPKMVTSDMSFRHGRGRNPRT